MDTAMEPTAIQALRHSLKLSQQEMATRLRVSIRALSKWETGKAKPSRLTLKRIQRLARKLK